jgi:hypothetical protein
VFDVLETPQIFHPALSLPASISSGSHLLQAVFPN